MELYLSANFKRTLFEILFEGFIIVKIFDTEREKIFFNLQKNHRLLRRFFRLGKINSGEGTDVAELSSLYFYAAPAWTVRCNVAH